MQPSCFQICIGKRSSPNVLIDRDWSIDRAACLDQRDLEQGIHVEVDEGIEAHSGPSSLKLLTKDFIQPSGQKINDPTWIPSSSRHTSLPPSILTRLELLGDVG